MSSRVAGAALAVIAAAMLVSSVVGVPWGWWDGHPVVNGETIHRKDINVGPLAAHGCNTGGDQACQPLELPSAFVTTGYVELAISGILALALLLLVATTLAGAASRKAIGTVVIVLAVIAAGVAVALIVQGPAMKSSQQVTLPIGIGLYLFGGGLLFAIGGSLIARRPQPPMLLRPSRQPIAPALAPPPSLAAPAQPPADVLAMFQPEPPRHAAPQPPPPAPPPQPLPIQPPPMIAEPANRASFVRPPLAPAPPSPGGILAGPSGPLGVGAHGVAPQFSPAPPQLRPLYDAEPQHGGTGGFVPQATPQPPSPFGGSPGSPSSRGSQGSQPARALPPPRPGSASAAPPLGPLARPKAPTGAPLPGPARLAPPRPESIAGAPAAPARPLAAKASSPSLPGAPLAARLKSASVPPPPARPKAPIVPPPAAFVAAPAPPPRTTIATPAVPPPPGPAPVKAMMLPTRAETEPVEGMQSATFDGAATLARGPEGGAPADRVDADDLETAAVEKLPAEALLEAVARQSQSEIETIAHERFSAAELGTRPRPAPPPRPRPPRPRLLSPRPPRPRRSRSRPRRTRCRRRPTTRP